MNSIHPPQKRDPDDDLILEEEIQESIHQQHHDVNITDGGEFLDDAIRMNDQPLGETIKQQE